MTGRRLLLARRRRAAPRRNLRRLRLRHREAGRAHLPAHQGHLVGLPERRPRLRGALDPRGRQRRQAACVLGAGRRQGGAGDALPARRALEPHRQRHAHRALAQARLQRPRHRLPRLRQEHGCLALRAALLRGCAWPPGTTSRRPGPLAPALHRRAFAGRRHRRGAGAAPARGLGGRAGGDLHVHPRHGRAHRVARAAGGAHPHAGVRHARQGAADPAAAHHRARHERLGRALRDGRAPLRRRRRPQALHPGGGRQPPQPVRGGAATSTAWR